MKTSISFLFVLPLLFSSLALATVFEHELLNSDGEPMDGIIIRAMRTEPSPLVVETVTDGEGKFSFDLADGNWTIEADPADILNRGYFCAPAIGIDIGDGFWNISPVSPPAINFIAIPLRPEITTLLRDEQVVLELDFDWRLGLNPILLRGYRIERSTDLRNWQPLATVLLSNPPIRIVDPAGQETMGAVYYRSVETSSVLMNSLDSLR